MITKQELMLRIIDLEMQAEEFDDRLGKLEKTLKNIDKNMAYIRDRIKTAVQIEIDDAWNNFMQGFEFDKNRNVLKPKDIYTEVDLENISKKVNEGLKK